MSLVPQIELYSHVNAIKSLVDWLRGEGWSVAAVFCMDVAFINEPSKYIAGAMQVRRQPRILTRSGHTAVQRGAGLWPTRGCCGPVKRL